MFFKPACLALAFVFFGGSFVASAEGLKPGGRESSSSAPALVEVASLEVQTSLPSLGCGESSIISATVTDTSGNPISGVEVSFVANTGSVSPNLGLTTADGSVFAVYTAPVSGGIATVTATVAGTSPAVEGSVDITVACGPSAVFCGGMLATIVGTEGNDRINGTPGRDVIAGLGGDDQISGRAGDDVICGGSGDDRLFGGDGNDSLHGGDGNDVMYGAAGDDSLYGNGGG